MLFMASCRADPDAVAWEKWLGSYEVTTRYCVLVNFDICPSCHYGSILSLCNKLCPDISILVYSGSKARRGIMARDCSTKIQDGLLQFVSDIDHVPTKEIFTLLQVDPEAGVIARKVKSIDEVLHYCL